MQKIKNYHFLYRSNTTQSKMHLQVLSLLRLSACATIQNSRRQTHREVVAKLKEKRSAKHLALEYFDFFYASTYATEWQSMRLAMLTGTGKHTALLNNYMNDSGCLAATESDLRAETALSMFDHLSKANRRNQLLEIPQALKVYCFDTGDTRIFKPPKVAAESTNRLLSNKIF